MFYNWYMNVPERSISLKRKISHEITLDIKKMILTGGFAPGDKLPSERELSARYNVSRIPVREAIAQLTKESIIRTEPNVGNFITESCDAYLLSKDISNYSLIDRTLLHESLLTRQYIESQCAREAAKNATQEDIQNIQSLLFDSTSEFTKLKSNERNNFFKEDHNFHLAIAQASHSTILINYMKLIGESISTHQFYSLQTDSSLDQVPNAHFKIYNAILLRDPDLAENEMNKHLERVIQLIGNTLI